MVGSAAGELVVSNSNDVTAVELVENSDEGTSVPVVSDTPTIVTLTSEILESSKRNIL